MSDSALPTFIHYGTAAERAAFAPDPPTISGAAVHILYIWRETDTGDSYAYDTAWHLLASAAAPSLAAILTADPATPANDTYWVRRTGTSPAMQVEIRVRIAGVTYTLGGITI